MKATVLSSDTLTRDTPSAAVRPAFLAAFRPDDLRSSSIAASTLPSAATSAFLHSIMPRPVRSRSSFTIAAVTAVMIVLAGEIRGRRKQKRGRWAPLCSGAYLLSRLFSGNFNEAVLVCRLSIVSVLTTLKNRVSNSCHVQLDGTNRVIVAWNNVVNAIWVGVGVNHSDHRNAQLTSFLNRDIFVVHVNDEQGIRQAAHVFNTADGTL